MPLRIGFRRSKTPSVIATYLALLVGCQADANAKDGLVLCNAYWTDAVLRSIMPLAGVANYYSLIEQCSAGQGFVRLISSSQGSTGSGPAWNQAFHDCFRELHSRSVAGTIGPVTAAWTTQKWHAKVAFRVRSGRPVAMLLGSSNITRPAFDPRASYFNHEADVLAWIDEPGLNEHFLAETAFGLATVPEIVAAEITEETRLAGIAPGSLPIRPISDEINKIFDEIRGLGTFTELKP